MSGWSAVILTGGRGTRLGVEDKGGVNVEGRSLLDRVLDGLPDAVPVTVVGPSMPTDRAVAFVLEEPRYGGPVAALAAALAVTDSPIVVVLAVDMPDSPPVAAECALRLAKEAGSDAVVPVDAGGRRQPLAAAYRADPLRAALSVLGDSAGRSMRELLAHLAVNEWRLGHEDGSLVADIDTPDDLAGYRRRVRGTAG